VGDGSGRATVDVRPVNIGSACSMVRRRYEHVPTTHYTTVWAGCQERIRAHVSRHSLHPYGGWRRRMRQIGALGVHYKATGDDVAHRKDEPALAVDELRREAKDLHSHILELGDHL